MSTSTHRWGVITDDGESADKGPYKLIKVAADGKEMYADVGESYGVQGSPIKGSKVLLYCPDGDEGRAVVIFCQPPPAKRITGQSPGEIAHMNHVTGSYMQHANDGNTYLVTKGVVKINCGPGHGDFSV
jgi:phage gp45-like